MKKGKKLYEGKAKIIFSSPEKNLVIQHFKDDATAYNNQKKASIEGKGILNNRISEHILSSLKDVVIENHLIKRLNMREQLVDLVEIIPIEFVVRNIVTGSLTKRLGIEDGTVLNKPLIEFKWIKSEKDLDIINDLCLRVNDFMQGMFRGVGIKLVDFKLEFGKSKIDSELLLADEISPDTCRLWDVVSEKKLDKDRFRKDLGNIIQAYQEVARRLGIIHEESNISEVKFGKPKAVNIKKK